MILAAGLTSRREPASFSRRLVELAFDGEVELVLTETLVDETFAVLTNSAFTARTNPEEAAVLVAGLIAASSMYRLDRGAVAPRRCADPDDDYLVEAALSTDAYLVSLDQAAAFPQVVGLVTGTPGTALRHFGFFED